MSPGGPSSDRVVPTVLAWYRTNARDLPWRSAGRTPWGVLVSEVMLQQTPVDRVLPVWRAWMERWPAPAGLAAASPAEVIRAWGRLGYPRRALRLRECAVALGAGGRVPDSVAALRCLPGIGDYTAAAVAAFAYGVRTVVLDTNIARVLARAVGGAALPSPGFRDERAAAAALLPDAAPVSAAWNQAVMELGALVCRSADPACEMCPLRPVCAWYGAGRPPADACRRPPAQGYEGTDRQARGRVLALLREHRPGVPRQDIIAALPRAGQAGRAIDSLIADGLAVAAGGVVRLPE